MNILQQPFPSKHYYKDQAPKQRIICHHTEGDTAGRGAIEHWKTRTDGRGTVCTPYIIRADGDVLQLFDPKNWAYALGLGSRGFYRELERTSVQIELASWGALVKKGETFVDNYNQGVVIPPDQVEMYPMPWRLGFSYFQKYTPQQIATLVELVQTTAKAFNIPVFYHFSTFFAYNKLALAGTPGLYGHTAFRLDKTDLHPQPDLVQALQVAFGKTDEWVAALSTAAGTNTKTV